MQFQYLGHIADVLTPGQRNCPDLMSVFPNVGGVSALGSSEPQFRRMNGIAVWDKRNC